LRLLPEDWLIFLQPNALESHGSRGMELEVLDSLDRRPHERWSARWGSPGIRRTSPVVPSCRIRSLCLVDGLLSVKHELVETSFCHWVRTASEATAVKENGKKVVRVSVVTGPAKLEQVHVIGLLDLSFEIGPPVIAHNPCTDPDLGQGLRSMATPTFNPSGL